MRDYSKFGIILSLDNVKDIIKVFRNTTQCKVYEMTPNQLRLKFNTLVNWNRIYDVLIKNLS